MPLRSDSERGKQLETEEGGILPHLAKLGETG